MSNSASQHIGVIGLGIIGSRVAENLGKAGYEVFVWSRSPRAIPNFLANPREVAESAHTLQIFVRDDAALLAAIEDMLPALTPAHLILNHATVSPSATLEAAERVSKTGAAFLDAPFTGSKVAAQNGKLVYYIGGDAGLMPLAEPVLKASSAKIMHVGKIGDATVLKIATNLITASPALISASSVLNSVWFANNFCWFSSAFFCFAASLRPSLASFVTLAL
jgi:3-hydroxyisobutyrate dehydrogenase